MRIETEEPTEQTFRFTITPTQSLVIDLNPVQFAPDFDAPMTKEEMETYVNDTLKGIKAGNVVWRILDVWNLLKDDPLVDFLASSTVDVEIV